MRVELTDNDRWEAFFYEDGGYRIDRCWLERRGYRPCGSCGTWSRREHRGLVPETAPADFLHRREGRITLLAPLTCQARAWVNSNLNDDRVEYAGNVVIEHPDLHDVLTGIIDAGLSIL
jgi:hypothetical protein